MGGVSKNPKTGVFQRGASQQAVVSESFCGFPLIGRRSDRLGSDPERLGLPSLQELEGVVRAIDRARRFWAAIREVHKLETLEGS